MNSGVDRREKTTAKIKPISITNNNVMEQASVIFNGVSTTVDIELKERFNVEIFNGLTLDCGIKLTGQQQDIKVYFDNFVSKIKQRIKEIKGE